MSLCLRRVEGEVKVVVMVLIVVRVLGEVGEGVVMVRCLREKRVWKWMGRGVFLVVREDFKEVIDESVLDILRDW